jgi:hypothetical protein
MTDDSLIDYEEPDLMALEDSSLHLPGGDDDVNVAVLLDQVEANSVAMMEAISPAMSGPSVNAPKTMEPLSLADQFIKKAAEEERRKLQAASTPKKARLGRCRKSVTMCSSTARVERVLALSVSLS